MPGRKYQAGSGSYRYGFNGKELDKDMDGNCYDYGFRIYNPQIGKFLSVDPLTKKYPELTPYQFASNSPIAGIDLDGLEFYYAADGSYIGQAYSGGTQLRIATSYEIKTDGTFSIYGYKEYKTNSEFTRLGRNELGNFTGIRTFTNEEVGRVLAFGLQVFKNRSWGGSDYGAVADESIGTNKNGHYGLLDFKFVAYDLLGIDPGNLLEIDGVVYNPGEAGNFLWAMVLAYQDIIGANTIAQIGSLIGSEHRMDEDYDQKALTEGDKYGEKLDELFSNNPAKESCDKYLRNDQSVKDVKNVVEDAHDGTNAKPNAKRQEPKFSTN